MALSIPEIMSRIPGAFEPSKAQGLSAVVHFKFSGAEPGEWNAVIGDGKCEVAQGIPHSRPTITVVSDSDDFRRIASGELDAAAAFMEGKLRLSGDVALATRLVSLFRVG